MTSTVYFRVSAAARTLAQETNLAGLSFWDSFFPMYDTGDAASPDKFDICNYVNQSWDENLNPNVKADRKPPRPPNLPPWPGPV